MKTQILTVSLLLSFLLFISHDKSNAQFPRTISFQGVLADAQGNLVTDGNHQLTLKLYDVAANGIALYTETQTVPVVKGIFNVIIGSNTPLPQSLTFDRAYFLGVTVDGGNELIPRTALTAVPYALRASVADVAQSLSSNATGVVKEIQNNDGTISIQNPNGPTATIGVANNSINTTKLSDGAVTSTKIASGQVVTSVNNLKDAVTLNAGSNISIAPSGNSLTISSTGGSGVPSVNSITGPVTIAASGGATVNTAGNTITINAGAGGGGTGIQGVQNTNNTLDILNSGGPTATINVKDQGITATQLADNAVTSAKIGDGQVQTNNLANASVTQAKIAGGVSLPPTGPAGGDLTGTYPNPNIANNAVTSAKIADGTIVAADIALGVIPNSLPPNGAAGGDLSGTYPNPTVANNAITTTKVADNAVTSGKIASGQVVKSMNTLKDDVILAAGTNVTITPGGNTLTIAATGSGGDITAVNAGTGLSGGGASGDVTLSVAVPLGLSGASANPIIMGIHTGAGTGVKGECSNGIGVYGTSISSIGVYGESSTDRGVVGVSTSGYAVFGSSSGTGHGVRGVKSGGGNNWAGSFSGNVDVAGNLSKTTGSFKIDHPLDPANKYLWHSFVESPDMMNIYNGNAITDGNGDAAIILPDYFEALNRDFRYQLTVIGQFAQAIVHEKIQNNRFTIRTDKPNVEVSWQVTGIRHDPYAEQHRIPVEEMKTGKEAGKYRHPKEHGVSESLGMDYEELIQLQNQMKKNQEREAIRLGERTEEKINNTK